MPTWVARLLRLGARIRPVQVRVSRAQARALQRPRGRVRRSFLLGGGQPVLALTTTGRRTGEPRTTTVAYLADGDRLVITGFNLGHERAPAWVTNLDAQPAAEVVIDGRRIAVHARRAAGPERDRLWAAWISRLPAAAAFAEIAGREIPVIVLEPV